jgi:hypothetical protein
MTTDNFCFYLQNRLIQTGQAGGQWYSDPSLFSIPCSNIRQGCKLLAGANSAKISISVCRVSWITTFFLNVTGYLAYQNVLVKNTRAQIHKQVTSIQHAEL